MTNTIGMSSKVRLIAAVALCLQFCSPILSRGQSSKKSDIINRIVRQSDTIKYSLFKGQPAPSKELINVLARQAVWDDEAGELNPAGLRLRFQLIDEQGTPGGPLTERYRIFVEGAPENKIYAFEYWPIDKPLMTDPRNIYVNAQGLLMTHRPKPEQEMILKAPDEEFVLQVTVGSAEPMRSLLSSMDGQLKVFGTIVPHPVMLEEQGCRLEVRIAQPDTTAVLFVADGFPAKTRIPLVLQSEGAVESQILDTNEDGHAVMAGFPYVPGKTQGVLRASAEGPNCLPAVVLPWGPLPKAPPKAPQQ